MDALASTRARTRQAAGFRRSGARPVLVNPPVPTLEDALLATADRLRRGWAGACPVCDGQLAPSGRCSSCGSELA